MEERKKVLLIDVERKVRLLPFFNPEKKYQLNFGQYIYVINTEISELKELLRYFRKDTLEFLEGTELTIKDERGRNRTLAEVFREKCFSGEGLY